MHRLFDIGFFIAIALACVGLDYYILKRDHGDQAFGLAQYIALRKGDVQDMLKPPSLAAALPSSIEGWDLHPNGADQILQGTAESLVQQASEVALVKAVEALEKANHPKGEIVGMMMAKGDIRLRMVSVLHKDEIFQAAIETAIAQFGAEPSPLQSVIESQPAAAQAAAYSVVDGVAFAELPAVAISGDPDLRMLRAQIGQELSVTFITKSTDDAAIRQAMQGIDFVALNKLLQLPLAGVADGRTTDARFDPENLNNNFVARLQGSLPSPQVSVVPAPSDEVSITTAIAPSDEVSITTAVAPNTVKTDAQPIAGSTEFIAPPNADAGFSGQPCVRRAGVLQCPEG